MHLSDIHTMFEYNTWANNRLFSVASELSQEQFTKDLGSSHGGIHGTLHHMMGAEEIWLRRWQGESPTSFLSKEKFPTFDDLTDHWEMLDHEIMSFCHMLKSDDEVKKIISYSDLRGNKFEQPLYQLMQHLVNHSSYHRGQVVTMLRQVGIKPVSTDMVMYFRELKK